MPMVIAGVVVVVVIAVVVIVMNKNKKQPEKPYVPELTADSRPEKSEGPVKPTRAPPPPIPDDIMADAKSIVELMSDKKNEADTLYDEGMAAKQGGDRDTWQSKLKQAETLYNDIREQWNSDVIMAIEGMGISNKDWDSEQIANHWLGKEGEKVSKAIERLSYIKKQLSAK